ncbi:hypothetical protein MMC30_006261 [Trapelia coarctata]|nr:hypothetical protein [Trapelia coarctata]
MRALQVLLAACIASSVNAVSLEAPVYIFDRDSQSSSGSSPAASVEPSAARLLLAHRLDLSQYHNLGNVDDFTLQLLNRFRGATPPLFSEDDGGDRREKLLVVVEGVDKPDQFFNDQQMPSFTILNPPSSSSNLQLTTDLLIQDGHRRRSSRSCTRAQSTQFEGQLMTGGFNGVDDHGTCVLLSTLPSNRKGLTTSAVHGIDSIRDKTGVRLLHDTTAIFHISILESVARDDGVDSQSYQKAVTHVKDTIAQLRSHPSKQEATIILMPSPSKRVKRTANAYGSYRVPNKNLKVRQAQAEEPLSLAHSPAASQPVSDVPSLHKQQASKHSNERKATLPICHTTKPSCIAATGNCSGHGTCYKKHNGNSSDSDEKGCWACGCNKEGTIRNNRTIYYGGPACSKEDISTPFFLLAGLTIALVAAISWGVGLMYSIGQEDLPSVIGAGVAGPSARK